MLLNYCKSCTFTLKISAKGQDESNLKTNPLESLHLNIRILSTANTAQTAGEIALPTSNIPHPCLSQTTADIFILRAESILGSLQPVTKFKTTRRLWDHSRCFIIYCKLVIHCNNYFQIALTCFYWCECSFGVVCGCVIVYVRSDQS